RRARRAAGRLARRARERCGGVRAAGVRRAARGAVAGDDRVVCTLLIGRDVTGPGQVLIAANRDEDPARPTDAPRVLVESPRIVGGRDRLAGGTWLALRAPHAGGAGDLPAAVMLLNRPPIPRAAPPRRSRGLLVLDVAAASDPRRAALAAQASGAVAPCPLAVPSPAACCWA